MSISIILSSYLNVRGFLRIGCHICSIHYFMILLVSSLKKEIIIGIIYGQQRDKHLIIIRMVYWTQFYLRVRMGPNGLRMLIASFTIMNSVLRLRLFGS